MEKGRLHQITNLYLTKNLILEEPKLLKTKENYLSMKKKIPNI